MSENTGNGASDGSRIFNASPELTSVSETSDKLPLGLPLSQITVLDLTLARAGPTCVRHLSDWGAQVIRIERPASDDEDLVGNRHGFDFQNLHRNKRSMQLDLKSPEGHAVFMRLVQTADVIVENMRPAVKQRLKVSWDDVRTVNHRIIYGSISGFGQQGPYSQRAGVDQIAQGMGGLMSITGFPGQGPVRVGVPIADLTAGTLLALGIMVALFDRHRTGTGRWVYTSLLESQIFMLDFQASRWLMNREVALQVGNDHPTATPTGVFPTSDGRINIAASSSRVWSRFCEIIGHPEWKDHEQWSTQANRLRNREALNLAISKIIEGETTRYWIDLFDKTGVPCGPIYTIDQVFADPQVQQLGITSTVAHPTLGEKKIVASALNIMGYSKTDVTPAPEADADTEAVLRSLGYSGEEIVEMREKAVI
jgi:crotonobetainyl-CoA:carnitine CoA-transferase CaiB-like acyl-CoA transferase